MKAHHLCIPREKQIEILLPLWGNFFESWGTKEDTIKAFLTAWEKLSEVKNVKVKIWSKENTIFWSHTGFNDDKEDDGRVYLFSIG